MVVRFYERFFTDTANEYIKSKSDIFLKIIKSAVQPLCLNYMFTIRQALCQEPLLRGAGGQQAAQGGAQDRPLLLGAVFVLLGNYKVLCVIFF